MNNFRYTIAIIVSGACLLALPACAPEVGSEKWCNQMKEKPKADWTATETANFAKYCIFK